EGLSLHDSIGALQRGQRECAHEKKRHAERPCHATRHRENPQSMFGARPYCLDSTGGKTVGFFRVSRPSRHILCCACSAFRTSLYSTEPAHPVLRLLGLSYI